MNKYQILSIPHVALKSVAEPVNKVCTEVQTVMKRMLLTMKHDKGIGLAANQVGILKRILVMDCRGSDYELDLGCPEELMPVFAANPEIIWSSEETAEMAEGCLSVPEQTVNVTRPITIKVKYLDFNNNEVIANLSGIAARCFQHEVDHLNGITLANHVSKLKADIMLRKINKYNKMHSN